jgi:predicted PurR-regulated permease PerM
MDKIISVILLIFFFFFLRGGHKLYARGRQIFKYGPGYQILRSHIFVLA